MGSRYTVRGFYKIFIGFCFISYKIYYYLECLSLFAMKVWVIFVQNRLFHETAYSKGLSPGKGMWEFDPEMRWTQPPKEILFLDSSEMGWKNKGILIYSFPPVQI